MSFKVEKILKGEWIWYHHLQWKFKLWAGKFAWGVLDKTLLGIVNKHLKAKSLLTKPSNVLPLYLKQTLLLIIWMKVVGSNPGYLHIFVLLYELQIQSFCGNISCRYHDEHKIFISLTFFAYLETLISLGIEADFPNAGKGGLVLMKKLHGACLGDPWSSSVLFRFESLDLEPKSRIFELENCYWAYVQAIQSVYRDYVYRVNSPSFHGILNLNQEPMN